MDFEGWEGCEHRDRQDRSSCTGKNVSKGRERRIYREAAGSPLASRVHDEKGRAGESDWGQRKGGQCQTEASHSLSSREWSRT